MKDFYALVHYWALKLSGLSDQVRSCHGVSSDSR